MYGAVRVATGTMSYKHRQADAVATMHDLTATNFLLKIIPHVDGSRRIFELLKYHLEDVTLKGVGTGPRSFSLFAHALAPVAELPILEVVSTTQLAADLSLGLGRALYDYLVRPAAKSFDDSREFQNGDLEAPKWARELVKGRSS